MFEVFVSHEVEKYDKKLDRKTKWRINKSIRGLSRELLSGLHIKKLWGELEGNYRYAMGDLRIVYEVDTKNKIVKIKANRNRGDVYKINPQHHLTTLERPKPIYS